MGSLLRLVAVAALAIASLALAAPPPAAAPVPAPAAKAAGPAEYPLSCNAAAKPLYVKGFEAQFVAQLEGAKDLYKQAIAADPKCAMAKAQLSGLVPGPAGKAMLEEAVASMAGLTEVEKLDLQAVQANRDGNGDKALALMRQLRDLAPNVYQVQVRLSIFAGAQQKFDEMLTAAKKAAELSPKSGSTWNQVGYAYAQLGKTEDAVTAFRKYAEVAPADPNAHDSLADALLRGNQVDEAGAEYQKAIDASGGKFWLSWDGVATVKALKGDWDGARVALAKHKEGGVDAADKANSMWLTAWTWQCQGKPAEALKALDAYEKEAAAAKFEFATAVGPVTRGLFLVQNGKYAEALKAFAAGEKGKADSESGAAKKWITSLRLLGTIEANTKSNKVPAAAKALAELEALVKDSAGTPWATDALAHGRGLVALGKKDPKAAVEALKGVTAEADLARLLLADAQDAAGDAAGATATRETLLKTNHRDPMSWYAHAKVEAKAKTPAKKAAAEAPKK